MNLSPRAARALLLATLLAVTTFPTAVACGSGEQGFAVPASTSGSASISSRSNSAGPTPPSSSASPSPGASTPSPKAPRPSGSAASSAGGATPRPRVTPSPSGAPTSPPPVSPVGQPGDSGTLTVRLAGFDPATGQLTYVKQHLVQPSGSQPYLDDDPADAAQHQAVLAPEAEIRFVYSSCQNGYGNPQSAGVVCTRADLAKAVGSNFVAEIDVVNGSVTAVRQIYQA